MIVVMVNIESLLLSSSTHTINDLILMQHSFGNSKPEWENNLHQNIRLVCYLFLSIFLFPLATLARSSSWDSSLFALSCCRTHRVWRQTTRLQQKDPGLLTMWMSPNARFKRLYLPVKNPRSLHQANWQQKQPHQVEPLETTYFPSQWKDWGLKNPTQNSWVIEANSAGRSCCFTGTLPAPRIPLYTSGMPSLCQSALTDNCCLRKLTLLTLALDWHNCQMDCQKLQSR